MSNQVDVLSCEGQKQGEVELASELFSVDVSEYALYRAVVSYEANQRQGTAACKTRAEVCRTSKKHHRQKGTGWARRGSLKSPVIRGGGVAFGPQPRSYRTRMNKSLKFLAMCSALTLKAQDSQVRVVADFDFEEPSTRRFRRVLDACGIGGGKLLFVTAEHEPLLHKSCRNIPTVKMTPLGSLGSYDVIFADTVLFTRSALESLQQHREVAAEMGESRSPESE